MRGIAELLVESCGDCPPFDVVTGVSAGAINAAYLASNADHMVEATAGLAELWSRAATVTAAASCRTPRSATASAIGLAPWCV
ncbi:MAG TPA: patatin-like phospholipase family protein, partial [Myxococcota bacterium]|nr:patatin-like phospholipase family protein [Myxococcota bacterium]